MDPLGLEPRASACFAQGTFTPLVAKAAIFQLIYEPSDVFGLPTLVNVGDPTVYICWLRGHRIIYSLYWQFFGF